MNNDLLQIILDRSVSQWGMALTYEKANKLFFFYAPPLLPLGLIGGYNHNIHSSIIEDGSEQCVYEVPRLSSILTINKTFCKLTILNLERKCIAYDNIKIS